MRTTSPGKDVQEGEEESLASGREDDLTGMRRQAAALEVAGGRLPRGEPTGNRAVAVPGSACYECVREPGQDRQSRLAEREVDHIRAGGDHPPDALVRGEGGRRLDRPNHGGLRHAARSSVRRPGRKAGLGSCPSSHSAAIPARGRPSRRSYMK